MVNKDVVHRPGGSSEKGACLVFAKSWVWSIHCKTGKENYEKDGGKWENKVLVLRRWVRDQMAEVLNYAVREGRDYWEGQSSCTGKCFVLFCFQGFVPLMFLLPENMHILTTSVQTWHSISLVPSLLQLLSARVHTVVHTDLTHLMLKHDLDSTASCCNTGTSS